MVIDFSRIIVDIDGQAIKDDNKKPMTLGRAVAVALTAGVPLKGREIKGLEKVENYDLAMRTIRGGEQEVTAEQIVTMKEYVNAGFNPLVVAQVWKALEI